MTMRKLMVLLGTGVLVSFGSVQATSQEGSTQLKVAGNAQAKGLPKVTAEKPMSFWMAKKLDYSKAILEGLTMGNFDSVAENATQMQLLGKIEGFVRRKNDGYRIQLRTFDFANQELIRQAKRKNVEGSALAFNQLTTSCVACHVMLREGIE